MENDLNGGGGNHNNNRNSNSMNVENGTSRITYTVPGILHYIQHEWARFEMERAHWEVERAELQVNILKI